MNQDTHYRNQEDINCHQSFKTSRYEEFKDRNPERVPGTCEWVLNHEKYQSWRNCPHDDLLWISADPGCGKSVFSKSLVDQELRQDGSLSICYFFFKDNEEQNSINLALCAVLHQLFTQKPELLHHAIPVWHSNKEKLQQETGDLWRILLWAARDPAAGHVVCVLDALDECDTHERETLIGRLTKFHNSSAKESSLKFLVTSRPYVNIKDRWHGIKLGLPTIWLAGETMNEAISKEINHVIDVRVSQISCTKGLSQNLQESLKTKLKGMSNRTYLWLYLVMEQIQDSLKHTQKAYDRIIENIPSSVQEAYEGILSKSTNKQEAQSLLYIMVGAARPLKLQEMDVAFSLATQNGCKCYADLDLDEANLETRIRNLCGLFVYVTNSRVYLIHQTAKEFLIQKKSSLPPSLDTRSQSLHEVEPAKGVIFERQVYLNTSSQVWSSSIQEENAEKMMADICIQYLLFTDFDGPAEDGDTKSVESPEFDFMDYAAINWTAHFRNAEIDEESLLLQSAPALYRTSSRRLQIWFSRYWKSIDYRGHQPLGLSNLHLAAITGNTAIVQKLLMEGHVVDVDTKDGINRTPLHWAALQGHEPVVRSLLERGADVDIKDEEGWTALFQAAGNGHLPVVQLLLEKGAEVDVKNENGHTALHEAAGGRHAAVVRLLLDRGFDVDVKDSHGFTALLAAAMFGYEAVVRVLLERGADIDVEDWNGRKALYYAAAGGHVAVMRLLLERGSDANVSDEERQIALHRAAEGGYVAAVQLLLDKGIDVNGRNEDRSTPLHTAARFGKAAVVKILLERGANVDAQNKEGRTALLEATKSDQEAVVQLLLEKGADIDIKDEHGSTLLHMAAVSGNMTAMKAALERGADVDAKDNEGRTALQEATKYDYRREIRLLLEKGADINIKDEDGSTPLHTAAVSGCEVVVGILLEKGADIDVKDREGRTALQKATECKQEAVVGVLKSHKLVH